MAPAVTFSRSGRGGSPARARLACLTGWGGRAALAAPWKASQPRGFAFESIDFSGVRGKAGDPGLLPLRLLKAFWQSVQVIRRVSLMRWLAWGGYIAFPAGMMSVLLGKPLILHEQNSVALAWSTSCWPASPTASSPAFPRVLKNAEWVGNPLRSAFTRQLDPVVRFAQRRGPSNCWWWRQSGRYRVE